MVEYACEVPTYVAYYLGFPTHRAMRYHRLQVSWTDRILVVAVATALGLWATIRTSSAQGAGVQVTDVKAVQVIEDVPLVPGKATALRIFVNSSAPAAATIEARLGSNVASRNVSL